MTIKPGEAMYGKRIGIIVEAMVMPELCAKASESICLEGTLSKEFMPTIDSDGQVFSDVYPSQITLDDARVVNALAAAFHPLNKKVERITVSNDYVIAMYVPNEETEGKAE